MLRLRTLTPNFAALAFAHTHGVGDVAVVVGIDTIALVTWLSGCIVGVGFGLDGPTRLAGRAPPSTMLYITCALHP